MLGELVGVDHAVSVYSDEAVLSRTVASFLAPAFEQRTGAIVIGTRAHIAAVEQRLRTDGWDVDRALADGSYLAMDAEGIVPHLLQNGLPTRETFDVHVGQHIARLAGEHGNVRAFGEIVAVLWRDGKRSAALRLEELWNDALREHPLTLLCGYAERAAGDDDSRERIARVHTYSL